MTFRTICPKICIFLHGFPGSPEGRRKKGRIKMSKKTIAQQVAELTQKQQDDLYKAGKIAVAIYLIVGIPWVLLLALGMLTMVTGTVLMSYDTADRFFIGYMIVLIGGALPLLGVGIAVKIKHPYYSDSKWFYINKMRKGKVPAVAVPAKAEEIPAPTPQPQAAAPAADATAGKPAKKSNHVVAIILLVLLMFAATVGLNGEAKLEAGADFDTAYAESVVEALITVGLVSVVMMIIPVICRLANGQRLPYESGNKLCTWNSVGIFLASVACQAMELPIPVAVGGLGALCFYFINKWLFVSEKTA